ncbi:MAG: ribonuclease Z [Caldilineales bacterium]|nr:ribonuclease Z [Caldilineales bacterium]
MTELIFLGIGGIRPQTAGDYTCLLLRHGDASILIDSGPSVIMQLDRAGIDPSEITHLYFSHQHGDHMLGSPLLLFHRRTRVIVGAPQVVDAWRQLVELVYPGYLKVLKDDIQYHLLPSDQSHLWPGLPDVCARIALVHHANLPAFALRLDFPTDVTHGKPGFSFVYSGDTTPTESVQALARGADLLVHEATYATVESDHRDGVHSSAAQAGAIAEAADVRMLALVHRLAGDTNIWAAEAGRTFHGSLLVPMAGERLTLPDDLPVEKPTNLK